MMHVYVGPLILVHQTADFDPHAFCEGTEFWCPETTDEKFWFLIPHDSHILTSESPAILNPEPQVQCKKFVKKFRKYVVKIESCQVKWDIVWGVVSINGGTGNGRHT